MVSEPALEVHHERASRASRASSAQPQEHTDVLPTSVGAYSPPAMVHPDAGSNFAAVLNMEGVDSVRTVTDHVIHVEARLGIEAARAALLGEFTSIYSNKTYATATSRC
jgi:hypothetical protein